MDPQTTTAIVQRQLIYVGQRPPWVMAAALLLLALVLWPHLRWGLRARDPWRRLAVLTRVLATGLLLWALLLPTLQHQLGVRAPAPTVVMVDNSASMRLSADGHRSRAAAAAQLLPQLQASLPAPVQLRTLTRPCATANDCTAPTALHTPLLASLRALPESLARPPGAVVVLSDGQATDGLLLLGGDEKLAPAAQAAVTALGAPISVVALGQAGAGSGGKIRRGQAVDLRLRAIAHDPYALVKTTTEVFCEVESWLAQPRQVTVQLHEDGRVCGQEQQALAAGHRCTSFRFVRRYDEVGDHVVACQVAGHPDELDTGNNVQASVLPVLRDKVRVLHVAGRPSWDERFLREVLVKDRNVELISFFILRTPDDDTTVGEHELSLIPFPVARLFTSELKNFDVVILQNFDFRPYGMAQYLPHLRAAVEAGLGLVMVGGRDSFAQAGYAGTALEAVLPVTLAEPAQAGAQSYVAQIPHTAVPSPRSAAHPLLAPPGQVAQGVSLTASLPPLLGINTVQAVREQAQTVLWGQPTGADGDILGDKVPLLCSMDAGRGRTVAMLTDGSWRWHFAPGEGGHAAERHRQLWTNILHWLSHDPALGRLHLTLRQRRWPAPEGVATVDGSLRALATDWGAVANAEVVLQLRRHPHGPATPAAFAGSAPAPLRLPLGEEGRLDWQLADVPSGVWQLTAEVVAAAQTQQVSTSFVVEPSPEQSQAVAQPAALRALASASKGKVLAVDKLAGKRLSLPQAPPPPLRVDAQTHRALWSLPVAVALFCLSWAASWLAARRRGGR